MFRALLCSLSGGQNCIIQHLVSSHWHKFIIFLYMFRALCAHHQEVKIALHSLWYHHTETSEWSKIIKIQFYKYEQIVVKFMCEFFGCDYCVLLTINMLCHVKEYTRESAQIAPHAKKLCKCVKSVCFSKVQRFELYCLVHEALDTSFRSTHTAINSQWRRTSPHMALLNIGYYAPDTNV